MAGKRRDEKPRRKLSGLQFFFAVEGAGLVAMILLIVVGMVLGMCGG